MQTILNSLANSRASKTLIELEQDKAQASHKDQNPSWLPERPLSMLLILLACTVAAFMCVRLALPLLSSSLANNLPSNWIRASSEQTLTEFDALQLQPSRLAPEQQSQLQASFAALTPPAEGAPPYRILFRASNSSTPLLFSLPSGDIVVTDRFFSSVPELDLQLALLCIELGHIQHQHTLHDAVSHKLIWLASAAFIGSTESSVNALSKGVRSAHFSLIQLQEADHYAQTMLSASEYPASTLGRAIKRLASDTSPAQLSSSRALNPYTELRLNFLQVAP